MGKRPGIHRIAALGIGRRGRARVGASFKKLPAQLLALFAVAAVLLGAFGLIFLAGPRASANQSGDGDLVYAVSGNATSQERDWSTSSSVWAAAAGTVAGAYANIDWAINKYSPTINQRFSAQLSDNGSSATALDVLRYSPALGWTNEGLNITSIPYANRSYRGYDVAVTKQSGLALLAYSTGTTGNAIAYRYWNPSTGTWAAATNINVTATSGTVRWIEAVPRPGGDEVALVWSDSNNNLGAAVLIWNGSAWTVNFQQALDGTNTLESTGVNVKSFDAAYEQNSGDLMVVWGRNTTTWGVNGAYYRMLPGSGTRTWSGAATITGGGTAFADDATIVSLSSRPGTDQLLFGSIGDQRSHLQTGYWSGTAWTLQGNADASVRTPAAGQQTVATGWVADTANNTARGVVVYADSSGTALDYVYWDGAAWQINGGTGYDFAPNPAFSTASENQIEAVQNPFDQSRMMVVLSDGTALRAEQLQLSNTTMTWSNTEGGSSLATLRTSTTQVFDFGYDAFLSSSPPGAVANFQASSGANAQSVLNWTNPTNANLATVVVLRKTGSYPTGHADAGAVAVFTDGYGANNALSNKVETYTDPGLTNGTTYYYAVFVQDFAGNWNDTVDSIAPNVNAATGTPGPVVTVGNTAVTTGNIYQGQTGVAMQRLAMNTNFSTATLNSITVNRTGTSADADIASVKIFADTNGNGAFDPGVDAQIGSGGFTGGSAGIPVTAQTISTAASNFFVVYDIASNSATGVTTGSNIASQASIGITGGYQVGAFSNYSSNTLTIGAVALTFSGNAALGGSTAYQGQTNQAMMKFAASPNAGSTTWNTFKLDEYGNGTAANNVQTVKLYRDDGDGVFNPAADTQISVTPTAFTTETATFTITGGETLSTTSKTYFVVYDIKQTASVGSTVGAQMVDNSYVGTLAGTVSGIANFNSGTPTVTGDVVSVTGNGTAPASVGQGRTGVKMMDLTVQPNYGSVSMSAIKIYQYGAGVSTAGISSVKMYRDDGDGVFNPAADIQVAANPASFTADTTTFILVTPETITSAGNKYYIVYDFASSAQIGASFGAQLTDATFVNVGSPATVSLSGPLKSGLTTIASQQVTLASQPIARGSVTVNPSSPTGQDYVAMQSLNLKTNSATATWSGITINDYGSGGVASNIAGVMLVKETNGQAGYQGPETASGSTDTVIATTPSTYSSNPQVFTLSTPETIDPNGKTYYLVYTIKNTAVTGTTVGTRIADQNSVSVSAPYTVVPFTNAQSNLLTIVSTPHTGFSSSTNLCQTCHSTHLAPDFSNDTTLPAGGPNSTNRILNRAYLESPDVVNNYNHKTYNLLCEACHDGTGANKNIKADYDGSGPIPGHFTKHAGTQNTGWNAPPAGKQYNAGVKIPCMICHDAHGSVKGNYKMISDGLYDYETTSTGGNWTDPNGNGKIDQGDEECLVCHEPAANSTTASTRSGVIMGIDMKMPTTHDKTSNCLGCHSNVHDLQTAPDSCSSCHSEIYNRTTNGVAGLHSTHTITSDAGNLTNAAGTCTGLCHNNHIPA
ncbi:MAG: cytochrome c family protein, partial [Chloroflexi bacterium]|nr:cytochrome c family protein [Chloroflexota bacterium]